MNWRQRVAAALYLPLGHVTPGMKERLRNSVLFPIYAAIYSWAGRRLGPGLYEIQGGPAKGLRIWVEPNLRRGYLAGLYEPAVTQAIAVHCQPGMTALDIGAHAGYFTLVMARAVGPEGRCIAFEPVAANARGIRATLAANDLPQVSVEQMAVGPESGTLGFRTHDLSSMGRLDSLVPNEDHGVFGQVIDVSVASLDAYAVRAGLDRVDFVKIDVEGAERLVVDGAQNVIRRFRPMLLVEVHAFEPPALHARPFVSTLLGLDYDVTDVQTGQVVVAETYEGGTILAVPAGSA